MGIEPNRKFAAKQSQQDKKLINHKYKWDRKPRLHLRLYCEKLAVAFNSKNAATVQKRAKKTAGVNGS